MIPSLLPPMSMTTLSRCTATIVPLTISPSLPNSPAMRLASKRLAKFSVRLRSAPASLPAEPRAVVVCVDMIFGRILGGRSVRPVCVTCTRGLQVPAGARRGTPPRVARLGTLACSVPTPSCQRVTAAGRRRRARLRRREARPRPAVAAAAPYDHDFPCPCPCPCPSAPPPPPLAGRPVHGRAGEPDRIVGPLARRSPRPRPERSPRPARPHPRRRTQGGPDRAGGSRLATSASAVAALAESHRVRPTRRPRARG